MMGASIADSLLLHDSDFPSRLSHCSDAMLHLSSSSLQKDQSLQCTENGGFLIASVGARFDTQRVSGELEMGKLVKIGPNCGDACLRQCVSNGNGLTPEHPRRERNSPRYYERP